MYDSLLVKNVPILVSGTLKERERKSKGFKVRVKENISQEKERQIEEGSKVRKIEKRSKERARESDR